MSEEYTLSIYLKLSFCYAAYLWYLLESVFLQLCKYSTCLYMLVNILKMYMCYFSDMVLKRAFRPNRKESREIQKKIKKCLLFSVIFYSVFVCVCICREGWVEKARVPKMFVFQHIYVYEKNERQFLYLLLRILCIEYFCRFEHDRLSVYRCVRAEVYLIQIQVSFVRYSILMSVFRYAMCKCMSVSMFEHVFVVFSICMYVLYVDS